MVGSRFHCGVIEGFYGRCWSFRQRLAMINDLANAGLNTYMIAPKFDLHHRLNWREPYPDNVLEEFRSICREGRDKSIQVILSLSPGLSSSLEDRELLCQRFSDLASAEPDGLALLMDDIPYDRADAEEHTEILNRLMLDVPLTRSVTWFFCPTAYSGWHLKNWADAIIYLKKLISGLPSECRIFWTGETIISKTIEPAHLEWVRQVIDRNPVIWDNFPADDYAPGGTFFPGPLTGRAASLTNCISGLMVNPSEIFTASRMVIRTLGEWYRDPLAYDPVQAFRKAIIDLTSDSESLVVLQDLFGYFYTPFDISAEWHGRLENVLNFYRDPIRCVSPRPDLEAVRNRLRADANLDHLQDLWIEVYPFVRTLLGDLDYLIGMCQRLERGEGGSAVLPVRDPRWSSPVNDLLRSLRLP
ncbi:beta-N-acetylglucosaminidase domain-containing protein [bacterium]|nr:beta-N-acetylglucosaminidase domain-containing protein [candidate division CSSED10-310 bacterium]